MADFDYVLWANKGTPITKNRLFQMSENDQHLWDRVEAMPRGVLGWAESTSETTTTSVGTTGVLLDNMTVAVTVEESRLIKVTYGQRNARNSALQNTGFKILMDGSPVTARIGALNKEWNGGPWDAVYIHSPSAGVHTYTVRGVLWSGAGTARWRTLDDTPRQLIVEDVGAYVAPQ